MHMRARNRAYACDSKTYSSANGGESAYARACALACLRVRDLKRRTNALFHDQGAYTQAIERACMVRWRTTRVGSVCMCAGAPANVAAVQSILIALPSRWPRS
eukprot:5383753-Pleurochrysis_carterae.AAC.1